MQITHQEARHLIQLRADNMLIASEKESLNNHLKACVECADYANEIQGMEAILRITMQKHWNEHYLPLPTTEIKERLFPIRNWLESLTTRSALAGFTVLFFVFAILQLTTTRNDGHSSLTVGVSVIPTPSLRFTGTQRNLGSCQMITYAVHQDDTLESLARKFMVSEDVITEINHLQPHALRLPERLLIPACELTPTGTSHPPEFTNTPSLEPVTYTPG